MVKMQAENNKKLIHSLSMGCRLNALESEKIQEILKKQLDQAIILNSCAVTAEAERQSGQTARKLSRENPNVPLFITGCAATRNPDLFKNIPNAFIIHNKDKLSNAIYTDIVNQFLRNGAPKTVEISIKNQDSKLSKQFIQVQNGCNHQCAYCITRQLRGRANSFEYKDILNDAKRAVGNGFFEIVLTGVDIASYFKDGLQISDVCHKLLNDVPEIQRLRLSSFDPASPEIFKLIDLIHQNPRMMNHMHLSMQSGCDSILKSMLRRHNADMVRKIHHAAANKITFSWDIICGFPGETEELFNETLQLINEVRPIKIHAFPFSPRPDTLAATLPHQVNRSISKARVKTISAITNKTMSKFMQLKIGTIANVLMEENNFARTENDIPVKIMGCPIPPRSICNVRLIKTESTYFIGEIV